MPILRQLNRVSVRRASAFLGLALMAALFLGLVDNTASAASSKGCEGGGFTVLGKSQVKTTLAANTLGTSFHVQGKYVQFDIDSASFGIRNYILTGAPNAKDITGGVPTPVFASKLPDHRGLVLTSAASIDLKDEGLEITRTGTGLTMKIQAQDCATGGIFQMEVERADGTSTLFTHTLAEGGSNPKLTAFYFDNRNFRNREGDVLPYKTTTVTVAARTNFGNDFSAKFVGRDSPQAATRRQEPTCVNLITTRTGGTATVNNCGAVTRWDVQSGGRMGQVMGEDAVEVAPPSTTCTHQCKAQDQVQGQAVVLGFPFPVAQADRYKPRFP